MTRELTPYDTGSRLEPKPWVDPKTGLAGEESPRPAEEADYGLVDFDDPNGPVTVATVWIVPNPEHDTMRMPGDDNPPYIMRVAANLPIVVIENSSDHVVGWANPDAASTI